MSDFLTFYTTFLWLLIFKKTSLKISLLWIGLFSFCNSKIMKIDWKIKKKSNSDLFTKNMLKDQQAHLNELRNKKKRWSISHEDRMLTKLSLLLSLQQTVQIILLKDRNQSNFRKKSMKFWCNTNKNRLEHEKKHLEQVQ